MKRPLALCHTVVDPYSRGCEPKGYHPAGTAGTRDLRMFQALLFEAVGPFNSVTAQSCLFMGCTEGTDPPPSYTHCRRSFREALTSDATEKPRSALEAQFAEWLLKP